jgi:hypothetical protein
MKFSFIIAQLLDDCAKISNIIGIKKKIRRIMRNFVAKFDRL